MDFQENLRVVEFTLVNIWSGKKVTIFLLGVGGKKVTISHFCISKTKIVWNFSFGGKNVVGVEWQNPSRFGKKLSIFQPFLSKTILEAQIGKKVTVISLLFSARCDIFTFYSARCVIVTFFLSCEIS